MNKQISLLEKFIRDTPKEELDKLIDKYRGSCVKEQGVDGYFTMEDMIDFATDQKNRGLEPTEKTLIDFILYR